MSLARLLVRDFRGSTTSRRRAPRASAIRALEPAPVLPARAFISSAPSRCCIGLGSAASDQLPCACPARRAAADRFRRLGLAAAAAALEDAAPCRDPRRGALCGRRQRAVVRDGDRRSAPTGANPLLIEIAFAGGMLAIPIAFLSFPALAAARRPRLRRPSSCSCRTTWRPPATALAFCLCLVGLSLRRSADQIAQLRRRIEIDWNAQRATRFIEEFEQAGRGWFWETTARGALSYVSEQLAADLKTPAARADRQAVRRSDRPRRPARRRILGTDPGLPPVGPPALHRHQRPRQHRRRNLVVAVGHAELRRAWPLPRLPRHRHRPHPAAPLRGGDQPPRQI